MVQIFMCSNQIRAVCVEMNGWIGCSAPLPSIPAWHHLPILASMFPCVSISRTVISAINHTNNRKAWSICDSNRFCFYTIKNTPNLAHLELNSRPFFFFQGFKKISKSDDKTILILANTHTRFLKTEIPKSVFKFFRTRIQIFGDEMGLVLSQTQLIFSQALVLVQLAILQ